MRTCLTPDAFARAESSAEAALAASRGVDAYVGPMPFSMHASALACSLALALAHAETRRLLKRRRELEKNLSRRAVHADTRLLHESVLVNSVRGCALLAQDAACRRVESCRHARATEALLMTSYSGSRVTQDAARVHELGYLERGVAVTQSAEEVRLQGLCHQYSTALRALPFPKESGTGTCFFQFPRSLRVHNVFCR